MTAMGHEPAFCEHEGTANGPRPADLLCKNLKIRNKRPDDRSRNRNVYAVGHGVTISISGLRP
jgi:hypothetical protein